MLGDHRHHLLVERRERVLALEPAPRRAIHLAQLVTRHAVEDHRLLPDAEAIIFNRGPYSHSSFMRHFSHAGFRALHTYLPCRRSQWWASCLNSPGVNFS